MMKKLSLIIGTALIFLLSTLVVFAGGEKYGEKDKQSAMEEKKSVETSEMKETCPVGLKDTKVEVIFAQPDQDKQAGTESETIIEYKVAEDDRAELRTRINRFAKYFDASGKLEAKVPGERKWMGLAQESIEFPSAMASTTPTDQGIRLVLRSANDQEHDDLENAVKQYAKYINNGQCPIIEKGV